MSRNIKKEVVSFNMGRAKYILENTILKFLINKNFTIFGGAVRDMIIHDEYSTRFYDDESKDRKLFDDPLYDKETIGRLVVPNDIDAFFVGTKEEVSKIVNELCDKERLRFSNNGNAGYPLNIFGNSDEIKLKRYTFYIPANSYIGVSIEMNVDIVYTSLKNILPPFKIADLKCNCLLQDQTGIRLSNHTGVYAMDALSGTYKAKKIEIGIINDIINFKTQLCHPNILNELDDEPSFGEKEIDFRFRRIYRLLNMIERGWTITDEIDIDIEVYVEESNEDTIVCLVCQENIQLNFDDICIKLKCCGCIIHKQCFLNYVKTELNERITIRCMNSCKKREDGLLLYNSSFRFAYPLQIPNVFL